MQKKLLLLACCAAAVFALFLTRPSPSVELDAGALDAGPSDDEWWDEGDGGEEDEEDAGIEALFDGGLEPLLDGGPDPIPFPDDDPIPVPPSALEPPMARDDGMTR